MKSGDATATTRAATIQRFVRMAVRKGCCAASLDAASPGPRHFMRPESTADTQVPHDVTAHVWRAPTLHAGCYRDRVAARANERSTRRRAASVVAVLLAPWAYRALAMADVPHVTGLADLRGFVSDAAIGALTLGVLLPMARISRWLAAVCVGLLALGYYANYETIHALGMIASPLDLKYFDDPTFVRGSALALAHPLALAAGVLASFGLAAWGLRDRSVWWVPATILGLNLIFLDQVTDWVPSFLYVANNTSYFGPTFTRILPEWFAFGLPFISTVLVAGCAGAALAARGQIADADARRQLLARISFPFAATLTLQTVCGTPVTHDYRLIAFLGLLPVLAIWCARGEGVPAWLRRASCIGFGLMLMFALRVCPLTTLSFLNLAQLLLMFSLLLLLATLILATRRNTAPA